MPPFVLYNGGYFTIFCKVVKYDVLFFLKGYVKVIGDEDASLLRKASIYKSIHTNINVTLFSG